MARETLKDFLIQQVGSSADKITYTLDNSSGGLGVDPNTNKELIDLANEAKGLLGDYLKFLVDNSSNEFKIQGGNSEAPPANRGNDLPLPDQFAESVHVEQGTLLKSELNKNSNSLMFENLDNIIDKQGGNFTSDGTFEARSSHNLLKDIPGGGLDTSGNTLINPLSDPGDVVAATQKMFLNNNRFSSLGNDTNNAFAPYPQDISEFEQHANNRGTISVQREFGIYNKDDFKASFEKLKNIGASLLLKSSGFSKTAAPGATDPSTTVENIEASVSSGENVAFNASGLGYVKRDTTILRAKNAHGFPTTSDGESIRNRTGDIVSPDSDAENAKSFGATYNQSLQFDGQNRKVHKIQAALSVIALINIANTFYDTIKPYLQAEDEKFLSGVTDEYVQTNGKTHAGAYIMGQSRSLSSLVLDATLFKNILTVTDHPYNTCVNRGIEICFGAESDDSEKISKHGNFAGSPGYWMAIANSTLKTYDNIVNKLANVDTSGVVGKEIFIIMKDILSNNSFLNFLNVMAIIGDSSLKSTNSISTATSPSQVKHTRDVDRLKNSPANRPGKSRRYKPGTKENQPGFFDSDRPVGSELTLSWEQSATPSMYLLPTNIVRAALRLNNSVLGENPARGMLGSRLVRNTYMAIDQDGTFNRIPQQAVKILEDQLDAEYVPFYFHDLRTNEILSFHAFLDTLTDTITPVFDAVDGYGRLDPVQIYKSTSRSLNVGFTVYATSRQDFDAMWYKINKFVTLLYPQWTQGTQVSNGGDNKFYQPFSQVIGASPIVRLRVGDVIKGNYSRFGLARTFGIGDKEVIARPVGEENLMDKLIGMGEKGLQETLNQVSDVAIAVYMALMGSPIGLVTSVVNAFEPKTGMAGTATRLGTDAVIGALSTILVNGFANPIAVANIIGDLRDPNIYGEDDGHGTTPGVLKAFRRVFILPNTVTGYYCIEDGKTYYPNRRMEAVIFRRDKRSRKRGLNEVGPKETKDGSIVYEVQIIDHAWDALNGKTIQVSHNDILPNAGSLFTTSIAGFILTLAGLDVVGLMDTLMAGSGQLGRGGGAINAAYGIVRSLISSPESQFMDAANNPFTRAYDTTKGRGLAGVIKGITFNWLDPDINWETDYNSRAPMGCKINFQFDVIHDLPPGLDHSGYNKAPIYNVGDIMKNVAGDPYEDGGAVSEHYFKKAGDDRQKN